MKDKNSKRFITVKDAEQRIKQHLAKEGKKLHKGTMEPILVSMHAKPYFVTDEEGNFEQYMHLEEIAKKYGLLGKSEFIAPAWVTGSTRGGKPRKA